MLDFPEDRKRDQLAASARGGQIIQRARHAEAALLNDMCINHGGGDIAVAGWFAGRKRKMGEEMKKKLVTGLTASLIIFGMFSGSASAAIVQNGNFEDVQIGSPYYSINPAFVPGWTATKDPRSEVLWHIGFADNNGSVTMAGNGLQFAKLGGAYGYSGSSSLSTVITGLNPGDRYVLDFKISELSDLKFEHQQIM